MMPCLSTPNLWVSETLLLKTVLATVWLPWLLSCHSLHPEIHLNRPGLAPESHRWPGPKFQSQCPFSCTFCPRLGTNLIVANDKDPVWVSYQLCNQFSLLTYIKNRLNGYWNFSKMCKTIFIKGYATCHENKRKENKTKLLILTGNQHKFDTV